MPFLRKTSRCGLFLAAAKRRRPDVVDLLLAFLHPRHVVGERHVWLRRLPDLVEAKRSSLAIASWLAWSSPTPSLSTRAELLPERRVLLRLVLGQILEQREHALDARWRGSSRPPGSPAGSRARRSAAGRSSRSRPRTNRRYAGISCSASSMMKTRRTYSLTPVPLLAVPQVERRAGRDEQQLRVFVRALDLAVRVGERRLEVVGDVLVELVVLLVGDLGLGPRPQRRRLVDGSSSSAWAVSPRPCPARLFIRIGRLMWSEYLRMIDRSR